MDGEKHLELLITIQKELSTNTEATKGIHRELTALNGRVSTHAKQIKTITKALLIVGTVVGTLLVSSGSELIKFLMAII